MNIEINITIAIPTYNRPEAATQLIQKIVNSAKRFNFQLLVLDNATNNGCIKLPELVPENVQLDYIRREVNVGLTRNVLDCFIYANRPWVIIIGDDVDLHDDFLLTLNDLITSVNKSDFFAVKLRSNLYEPQKEYVVEGLDDFIDSMNNVSSFSSVLWVSSWLYRKDCMIEYLAKSYLYSGMQAPHMIGIYYGLYESKGKVLYSDKRLAIHNKSSKSIGWDYGLTYALMVSTAKCFEPFMEGTREKRFLKAISGNGRLRSIAGFYIRLKLSGNLGRKVPGQLASISIIHFLLFILIGVMPVKFLEKLFPSYIRKGIVDRM